jgi:hypothetical protein
VSRRIVEAAKRFFIGSRLTISSHLILSILNSSAKARSKSTELDAMRTPKENQWTLLPGLTRWQAAWRLRHNAEVRALRPTLSPQEALAAAAEGMSDTLRSALALVHQAKSQVSQPLERRKERKGYVTAKCGTDR